MERLKRLWIKEKNMKKLFVSLFVTLVVFSLQGQTVDYELEGFVNENDELVYDLNLILNQDFSPRVKIKNNGPGIAGVSDTLFFDVYVNDNYSGMRYLRGSQLQNILPGQSAIISWLSPVYDASVMDMSYMTRFAFCFELRLEGSNVDPDLSNNRACVQVDRPLAVEELGEVGMKVYPNPVADICRVECEMWNGGDISVSVYDIFGKEVKCQSMESGALVLDMSGLSSGIYVMKVMRDGKVIAAEKLVKR